MIDKLHFISQECPESDHIKGIEMALKSGCKWIQLRIKNQVESDIYIQAKEAKKLCDLFQAKLIINDFPNIAKAVNAHGVHLGLLDTSITEARKIVGNELIIGGTANTFEDIMLRVESGADYIGLGPLRFTPTKKNLSPVLGIESYKNIMRRLEMININIPIIAIGGIQIGDIMQLKEAGVYGVAVSGSITLAKDQARTVNEYYSLLEIAATKQIRHVKNCR